jgi:hypothetical protein
MPERGQLQVGMQVGPDDSPGTIQQVTGRAGQRVRFGARHSCAERRARTTAGARPAAAQNGTSLRGLSVLTEG